MYFYKGVNIIKKKLFIIITFIILSSNIITAAEEDNTNEKLKETGFSSGLASVILISIDDSSNATLPFIPLRELRDISLTITYSCTSSGRFISRIFLRLLKNRRVNINLNIVSQPDWCHATLSPGTMPMTISGERQNMTAQLTIALDETAPAYERGTIEINVSTPDIKGRFGKITLIKGFEQMFYVNVMASYIALMDINPKSGVYFKLTPYNITAIPIEITNQGNGRTKVFIDIENVSDKWVVNITDSIILEPDGANTVFLYVKTDDKYDIATIRLIFTPTWVENVEIKGKSEYVTFHIENDGSYVEKNNTVDLIYYIIALLIIALIIIFIVIRWKRNKIK